MADLSDVKWGNVIPSTSSSSQGKIGIRKTTLEDTDTSIKVKIEVWFWSRYSVDDTNNKFYFDEGTSVPITYIKKCPIDHPSNSSWSTSNQTLLYEKVISRNKTNTSYKYYVSAKFTGIDILGSSSVASVDDYIDVAPISEWKIAFNANGGTGAPASIVKKRNVSVTIPTTKPTRTGYVFAGWSTNSLATEAESKYNPGATYSANANITLYAVWTNIVYFISYDANGGDDISTPPIQPKPRGASVNISTVVPIRDEKHIFKGWSTTADGDVEYTPGAVCQVNKSITLYAVWEFLYVKPRIYDLVADRCAAIIEETEGNFYVLDSSNRVDVYQDSDGVYRTEINYKVLSLNYIGNNVFTADNGIKIIIHSDLYYALHDANKVVEPWNKNGEWYTEYMEKETKVVQSDDGEFFVYSDNGTHAAVSFVWETDLTDNYCEIEYKLANETWDDAIGMGTRGLGGANSGKIVEAIGEHLSSENVYDIRVIVRDEKGESYSFITLASEKFVIDLKAGGDGIAFGKTATIANTVEFEFDGKFNKPVYGKALGMDKLPSIPEDDDLDNYLDPGCYAIYSDDVAETVINCPVTRAGRFEVWSSNGNGIQSSGYSYIRQVYKPFELTMPVYERDIKRFGTGAWEYSEWHVTKAPSVILYRNDSGTNATVSLSATIDSFHHIEIFFTDNNGIGRGSTKINRLKRSDALKVDLSLVEASHAASTLIRRTRYTLSGSTMIPDLTSAGYLYLASGADVSHKDSTRNFIYVTEVIGYYL